MKHQFLAAVVLVGGFAMQANAACDYPVAPGKFPDGSQASLDEMKAAKASVVKYNADMETYLEMHQVGVRREGCLADRRDSRAEGRTGKGAEPEAQRGRRRSYRGHQPLQRAAARLQGEGGRGEEALLTLPRRAGRVRPPSC